MALVNVENNSKEKRFNVAQVKQSKRVVGVSANKSHILGLRAAYHFEITFSLLNE